MSGHELPDKVYVVVSGQHKVTLHADEDCHALLNCDAREVDASLYPNSDPCELCTDHGGDFVEKSRKGGEAEGYTDLLKQADSLDDIREGTV